MAVRTVWHTQFTIIINIEHGTMYATVFGITDVYYVEGWEDNI